MLTIRDGIAPVRHEGTASPRPLAFRHDDPIGRMGTCVHGRLVAAAVIADGALRFAVRRHCAWWQAARGRDMPASKASLSDLSAQVLAEDGAVARRSGRPARVESLERRYL